MLKYLVVVFYVFGVVVFDSIFTTNVSIRTNIPAQVDAGGKFTAEIIISKGALDKFARFKMDLPDGFKATPKIKSGGEFTFENQSVVFFWIKLPYEDEFSISFDVEVAPTAQGDFTLEGTFSYIEDNQRETITMEPQSINVVQSEYAEAAQDEEAITFTYGNITERGISCIRQKPFLNDQDEVIVNLLVNKGEIKKFGKISEVVPLGFNAVSIKGKNSIFTFKNHEVKFSWLDLPGDPQFVVSYKLIPEGQIDDRAFIITGSFSYIGNEQLKEVEIVQRDIDLDSFQPSGLVAATETSPETSSETTSQETVKEEPVNVVEEPVNNVETKVDESNVIVEEIKPDEKTDEVVKEPQKEVEQEKELVAEIPPAEKISDEKVTDVISNYTEKEYEPKLVSVPEPENGIAYRVQIAAGHRLVKPEYFRKLNVYDEIRVEIHEGWHKYTIGSFRLYKDARDYRIHVWNTTPINDAFVAAYNFGDRITVQEALMIANQKWYK